MIIDTKKVTISDDFTVELPDGSIPRQFINQGTKGDFLWFENSLNPGLREYRFAVVNKGEGVPSGATFMQVFKENNYKLIYRLP